MTKKRARTTRRETERDALKLADARERLAKLEQGGSCERPMRVESASQIELRAEALRCPRCESELRVHEHVARVVGGQSLRMVDARCKQCGAQREVWFVIASDLN